MLILRKKEILIDGEVVRLYSVDGGRTWVSDPSDFKAFQQRRAEIKQSVQEIFARQNTKFSEYPLDFWGV
jgi:hypothetical protein